MARLIRSSVASHRGGFTLVELLVAMALTLLMMAGLARAFAVISQSIRDGRSQLTLSSQLRNLSFRMRTDLRTRTINATPTSLSGSGSGYFMYYEGPLTEQTFGMYGAAPTRTLSDGTVLTPDLTDTDGDSIPDFFDPRPLGPASSITNDGPTYRQHGRLGDFDDYLAFTAKAPGDEWFTGKVPAYLVNANAVDPMAPTVISSKFAEIIIWASPEWQVTNGDLFVNPDTSATVQQSMPIYRDDNRDLVPDRVVLHQRVLLIRPDLNVQGTLPFPNSGPLANVYPIDGRFGDYVDSGSFTDTSRVLQSNWLTGMAPIHQFFDVSLRRVINPNTGFPTEFVAANSLEDLNVPHNRFAHVRYPGRYFGRGDSQFGDWATSMPLLALGWNDAILNWQGVDDPRGDDSGSATPPAWFPARHPSPLTLNNGSGSPRFSGLFNGWLLPHFELGDANQPDTNVGDHWGRGYFPPGFVDTRWDRTGEDVIASNVLSFDIRGFDPSAPVFLSSGPDQLPGRAFEDDDGVPQPVAQGTADQTAIVSVTLPDGSVINQPSTELGTPGTDDIVVQVGDNGIYEMLGQPIMNPSDATTWNVDLQAVASYGSFVDLAYPYLAGSPLRNRTLQAHLALGLNATPPPAGTPPANAQVGTNYVGFMNSEFSLFPIAPLGLDSLKRSGKLVHIGATGAICFMQPTYDTWTDFYESDGFDQTYTFNGSLAGDQVGTTWGLNRVQELNNVPIRSESDLVNRLLQVDTGLKDPSSPETSPPFNVDLEAIQITIRVQDPANEEMSQMSIVQGLQP